MAAMTVSYDTIVSSRDPAGQDLMAKLLVGGVFFPGST